MSDSFETSGDTCELGPPGDPVLTANGWVRRQFADADRAKELVEVYTSIGYEVKVCEITPSDMKPECRECAARACRPCVIIYTRNTTKLSG